MGAITDGIGSAFRDFVMDGVPATGPHEPVKSEIRAIGPLIEAALGTAVLGTVNVAKATRTLLNGDLAHAADSVGLVYADSTDANNDLYVKVGASGSGSWTLTTILHSAIAGAAAAPLAAAATSASNAHASELAAAASAAAAASIDLPAERATRLLNSLKAAGGPEATHVLLLDENNAKTFSSGANISTLADTAQGLSAVLHSTLYSGANPQPVSTANGISFNSQAGLTVAAPVLPTTGRFCAHHVFQISVDNSYTTKALMNAASPVTGDIRQVTADTLTTYTPDLTHVFEGGYPDADLVRGFYPYDPYAVPGPMYSFKSTAGYLLYADTNRLGQYEVIFYGPNGLLSVHTTATNVIDGKLHQASIFFENSILRLVLDGIEIDSVKFPGANSITDFTTFYLNGTNARGSNPLTPINGLRHKFRTLDVWNNPDRKTFARTYDAIAVAKGLPVMKVPPEAWGIAKTGQSLASGTTATATDTWVTPSGWNGEITRQNPTYSGDAVTLDRTFVPHLFAHASDASQFIDNSNIGPVAHRTSNFGTNLGGHTSSSGGETIDKSIAKHLFNHPKAPPLDLVMTHIEGAGSYTLLSQKTSPPYLVQALRSQTASAATQYELLLQSIIEATAFAEARGQRYRQLAWWLHQGFAQPTMQQTLDFYDMLNADIKRITGQGEDVIALGPQINVSTNGTSNTSILLDQAMLDAVDNRGTRPIYCIGPMYQIDNHTHPYRAGYRWIGEVGAKVLKRIVFDGANWEALRPRSFTLGANYVDVRFYLQPSYQLQFVDTNANNVSSRVTTGGVDTFGFEYSGGGRTITGVAIRTGTTTNDTVRVSLSGAPAAGHTLSYVDLNSRFGNLCDTDPEVAYFRDQDWTVPIVSGRPVYAEGLLNDLRNWGCAFRKVL